MAVAKDKKLLGSMNYGKFIKIANIGKYKIFELRISVIIYFVHIYLLCSVLLNRVTSSNIVPSAGDEDEEQNVNMHNMASEIQKDSEEIIISWQQKIFSQVDLFI